MVYTPAGSFFAGDNATSDLSFTQGSSDTDPWYIGSEGSITTANAAGTGTGLAETAAEYYYPGQGDAAGSVFTIPAAFPKGYQAHYMMKGEISQGQWVGFFNTLTATQKSTRDITATKGDNLAARNNVSWTSGDATLPDQGGGATYEGVAMNYLSRADLPAYLDWSGLRPMSELEFERAGRGPYRAVSGEYAWGSTSITQATSISNAGLPTERAQSGANANFDEMVGPLRVGSFAYGVATRIDAGAGYYGAMELSGNLFERSVTVGTSTGRSFEGRYHGNGALDASGNFNVSTWPGVTGSGLRGGVWNIPSTYAQLSDRTYATFSVASRDLMYGGRGVRVATDVSLLLHMDGTNGSTTFTDSGPNALAVTAFGNAQISTTQSQYGGASGYFDGTGDYITYSSASLFDFSEDFTIEGWWNFTQINQYQGFTILFCGIELDRIQLATVSGAVELYWGGPLISYSIASSGFLNTWTHFAVTRSGTAVKLWINGLNVASATKTTTIDVSGISLSSQLNNGGYHGYFNGYVDEFRVTKGVARYTSTFTPTGPFPNP